MKQQNEFYAIAKKGTNRFLCKYQNNERAQRLFRVKIYEVSRELYP